MQPQIHSLAMLSTLAPLPRGEQWRPGAREVRHRTGTARRGDRRVPPWARRCPQSLSGSTSDMAPTGRMPTGCSPTRSRRTSSTRSTSNSRPEPTLSIRSKVGFDSTCIDAIASRLDRDAKVAFELLDNEEMRATLVVEYLPRIYARARVARQRTCPIGEERAAERAGRKL